MSSSDTPQPTRPLHAVTVAHSEILMGAAASLPDVDPGLRPELVIAPRVASSASELSADEALTGQHLLAAGYQQLALGHHLVYLRTDEQPASSGGAVEGLLAQLGEQTARADACQLELQLTVDLLRNARERLADERTHTAAQSDEIAGLKHLVSVTQDAERHWRDRAEAAESQAAQLAAEHAAAARARDESASRAVALQEQLTGLQASRSWRLTRPLRGWGKRG